MTHEQIEKAAGEISYHPFIEIERQGFIRGANWRIKSVWHDINERPKFPGKVECVKFLLLRKNGECDRFLIGKCDWDDFMDTGKFVKWAYIDDFLPERKEEAK